MWFFLNETQNLNNMENDNLKNKQQCVIHDVRHSIYLIEKGWIDPMENRNADGYDAFGYTITEQEAKEFCESKGCWTDKDCWSVAYYPDKKMVKYRYKEISYCT